MKNYELNLIFKAGVKININNYINYIKNNKGIVILNNDEGEKKLCYKIKNNKIGHYFFLKISVNLYLLEKLINMFKFDNLLIRFLIVKY